MEKTELFEFLDYSFQNFLSLRGKAARLMNSLVGLLIIPFILIFYHFPFTLIGESYIDWISVLIAIIISLVISIVIFFMFWFMHYNIVEAVIFTLVILVITLFELYAWYEGLLILVIYFGFFKSKRKKRAL